MTARWDGELRVRHRGDPGAGARYLPAARLFVAQVIESMTFGNLIHASRSRVLPDGTRLRVIIDGGVPIVEITPVPAGRKEGAPEVTMIVLGGVILTPRSVAYPDGLNEDNPEVLVKTTSVVDSGYICLFFDDESDAYAVAINKDLYPPLIPDGLKEFGNIDWVGDGDLSCSWYGPRSRYFPCLPTWVGWSTSQVGHFRPNVYSCGLKLLDGAAYAATDGAPAETAWPVIGACVRRVEGALKLLAVHAHPDINGASAVTLVEIAHKLISYDINATAWTVSGATVLLSFNASEEGVPWFFNASGTAAVRVASIGNTSDAERSACTGRIERLSGETIAFSAETIEPESRTETAFPAIPPVDGLTGPTWFGASDVLAMPPDDVVEYGLVIAADFVGDTEVFARAAWVRETDAELGTFTENGNLVANEYVVSEGRHRLSISVNSDDYIELSSSVWTSEPILAAYVIDEDLGAGFPGESQSHYGGTPHRVVYESTYGILHMDLRSKVLSLVRRETTRDVPDGTGDAATVGTVRTVVNSYVASLIKGGATVVASGTENYATGSTDGLRPGPSPTDAFYRMFITSSGLYVNERSVWNLRTAFHYQLLITANDDTVSETGQFFDKVVEKDGFESWGTWNNIGAPFIASQVSIGSTRSLNYITGATMASVTGVQGDASFYPGSPMPKYFRINP